MKIKLMTSSVCPPIDYKNQINQKCKNKLTYYNYKYRALSTINYLITESEVVMGKSQIEALPYWPRYRSVNTVGWGLKFSRNDRTVKVIKLFIIWLMN